jgi:hypothetical protein
MPSANTIPPPGGGASAHLWAFDAVAELGGALPELIRLLAAAERAGNATLEAEIFATICRQDEAIAARRAETLAGTLVQARLLARMLEGGVGGMPPTSPDAPRRVSEREATAGRLAQSIARALERACGGRIQPGAREFYLGTGRRGRARAA